MGTEEVFNSSTFFKNDLTVLSWASMNKFSHVYS